MECLNSMSIAPLLKERVRTMLDLKLATWTLQFILYASSFDLPLMATQTSWSYFSYRGIVFFTGTVWVRSYSYFILTSFRGKLGGVISAIWKPKSRDF